jgi:hypothetical protein
VRLAFASRAVVVGSAVVTAAALVIWWRATRLQPIVLAHADRRSLEARLSYAPADRWRPYGVERPAARAMPREEVRVDTLAQLQKRGEWRGLGDAYLLAGEPGRAAEALACAGESADVESDRAALALAGRDSAAALAHATRALWLAPAHAPAAWNRGLALRDLGLVHVAANAFETIAARGDNGWSDEAKTRAATLRRKAGDRERSRVEADAAGKAMVAKGEPPRLDLVRAHPQLMDGYLEAALAKINDRRQLAALIPAAEALDAIDAKSAYGTRRASRFHAAAEGRPKQLLHDGGPDPRLALKLMLDQAREAWQQGQADAAQKSASAVAEDIEADPTDERRRALLLLAEIAQAERMTALADAYVEEARLLVSGPERDH